ncbi:response regulator [Kangiella profundi]|uniref:Response regulator n=1 Tax=Kangiella profundi TaxID=1561924 RepID=A0A2K9ANV5_9GAMM|nr:response regulator [Kangiella profundi]AUD78093.1 response regulator [Kangiella profundi]GGF04995.1 hypothetical protein GCM10011356_18260 [Kangiella profundi]
MSAILLVDDSHEILANTAQQLTAAGHDYHYAADYKEALNYIRLNRPQIRIVVVALNNALGYPSLRKIKSGMSERATIIVYSDNKDQTIASWVKKLGIEHYYEHNRQEIDLFNRIKRSLFQKGMFFTNQQLKELTSTLSKYTSDADKLVKETAPQSKSLQELQHKLARRLEGIENQRGFLLEAQKQ